jgi:predicted AlkP superfamily phosphohydrolase/phosphomutase
VRTEASDYWESRRPGRRFVLSNDLSLPTFWDVAGAAGKRVAVVNMPVTFPAWPVNGTMVTGLLTPAGDIPGQSHPAGVLADYPEYRVDLRHAKGREAEGQLPPVADIVTEMTDVTERRRRLMTDLVAGDVDLAVMVFVGMDRVSHRAWPSQRLVVSKPEEEWDELGPAIAEHYRTLDSVIGSLMDAAGDEATVLFTSDHGFADGPDRKFRANAWLRDAGYLTLKAGGLQKAAYASFAKRLARKALKTYRRKAKRPAEHLGMSWAQSKAYAVQFSWCPVFGITVNEAGVKRQGSVPRSEIPALLERLEADLAKVTDPESGTAVVRRTWRREEVADGDEVDRLPHLFVEVDPRYFPDDGLRRAELFDVLETNSGRHAREGLLGAFGPRVNASFPGPARIEDVGPTVLALLGLEAPPSMDGRVLHEMVDVRTADLAAAPEAATAHATAVDLSEEDQEAIERHLRDLGYEE